MRGPASAHAYGPVISCEAAKEGLSHWQLCPAVVGASAQLGLDLTEPAYAQQHETQALAVAAAAPVAAQAIALPVALALPLELCAKNAWQAPPWMCQPSGGLGALQVGLAPLAVLPAPPAAPLAHSPGQL